MTIEPHPPRHGSAPRSNRLQAHAVPRMAGTNPVQIATPITGQHRPTSPSVAAGHQPSRPSKPRANILSAALHQQAQCQPARPQWALAGRAGLQDGRLQARTNWAGVWTRAGSGVDRCGIPSTSPRDYHTTPGAGLSEGLLTPQGPGKVVRITVTCGYARQRDRRTGEP